jgi:hypothetical protein
MSMKSLRLGACLCLVVMGFAVGAWADGAKSGCKTVRGRIIWTVIPAPNDPFGRVLGTVTGALNGGTSATILEPPTGGPDGVLHTHDLDVFAVGAQDILFGESRAAFTPIPGKPGTVQDSQTITITGGSGKFAKATGSLQIQGTGYNLTPQGASREAPSLMCSTKESSVM